MISVVPIIRQAEVHPHQKPVALMEQLCEASGGQTILDPFMGSGSTLVAALRLNRRALGIEIDQKWFDVAVRRVEAASKQDSLFA